MTPPPDPGLYDLFVSYSTRDDRPPPGERLGWVGTFVARLRELAKPFTSENISTTGDADAFPDWDTFYAPDAIQAGHLWEPRLRTAVAHSRVFLACLSPNYWQSRWCRIEWETYLENESARGLANQIGGITPIYFIEHPDIRSADILAQAPEWARALLAERQVRLLDFSEHGADLLARLAALRGDSAAGERIGSIAKLLSKKISHARRAERGQVGNIAIGTDTFVGRDAELRTVEGQLFGGGALGVITALRGIGGQGKTALALRYAQNLRTRYPGGCWQVGAERATEILTLVASLREPLGLPVVATDSEAATARRVLAELHRRAHDPEVPRQPGDPAAVLLLVDNVDHAELLGRSQRDTLAMAMRDACPGPDLGWLHVLATTRLDAKDLSFLKDDQIISIDALPEGEALRLWLRISGELGEEEIEAAKEIIRIVERHTLTVEIAARHIRRTTGETSVTYLKRLRHALSQQPGDLARLLSGQERGLAATDLPGYAHPLAATLGFTFDRLAEEDPAAAAVLHYAAHWPAEAVPLPWLRILAGNEHPELLAEPEIEGLNSRWDDAELRLRESLRLLTPADVEMPEVYRLHRLAGVYLRAAAEGAGEDARRAATVERLIEERCTSAEYDPQAALAPWERSVLLVDLLERMGKRICSNTIARQGMLLGQILMAYADLTTCGRLFVAAHTVLERLAASDPHNAGWQRDLSVSLSKLGDLAVAQGDLAAARDVYTESKRIAERLAASDPHDAQGQRDLSVSQGKLGDLAVAQGDLAAAREAYTEDKRIAERLAASDPHNAEWQRDLSISHLKLGDLAVAQGDLAAAREAYAESKRIAERLAASDPRNARWQRDLSVSHNNLGDLAVAQGDLAAARDAYSADKRITERLAASDPHNAGWQRDLSVSLSKLGDLAVAQGDLAAARDVYTESKRIAERLAASDPQNAQWQRDLSISHNRLGDLAVAQGDLAAAREAFTEGKRIAERLAASDPHNAGWQRDLSVSHSKLGNLAVAQGDLAAARDAYTECNRILARLAASDPHNAEWQRDLSVSLSQLGNLAVAQGDLVAARDAFTEYNRIAARLAANDPHNAGWQRGLAISHNLLGTLARREGRSAEWLASSKAALAIIRRIAAGDPSNAPWQQDVAGYAFNTAIAAQAAGEMVQVSNLLTESWSILSALEAQGKLPPAGPGRQLFDHLRGMMRT